MSLKYHRLINVAGLLFGFLIILPLLAFAGNEYLDKGEELFNRGKLGLAQTQLMKSLEQVGSRYDELKVRLLLARIHLKNNEIEKARNQLGKVINLSPVLELDEVEYPPDIIRLFNQTRGQMLGSVSVITEPSGSDVYVGEKESGFSPITIVDLLEGEHKLRISKDGFKDKEVVITVNSGKPTNIFVELEINDTNPPSIVPLRVEEAKVGLSQSISAKIIDDNAVGRSFLFYRSRKGGEFKRVTMEPAIAKDVYYGIVPGEDVYGESLDYYFSSEDISQNIIFEGDSNYSKKLNILSKDREPPVIEHQPVESISDASKLFIEATVSDDFGVEEVLIAYRSGMKGKYSIERMVKGNRYSIQISKSRVRVGIFEYYLIARDGSGNSRFSGTEKKPHRIKIYKAKPYFEGVIVSREKKGNRLSRRLIINLGSKHHLKKGDIFFVFKAGQKIVDPITNEILRVEEIVLGRIKLLRVGPRTSVAEVVKEDRKFPIGSNDFIRKRPGKTYGLRGTSIKKREVTLTWNANHAPETAGYYIHRSFDKEKQFTEIGKVKGIGKTVYKDRSKRKNRLEDGVEYYYKVTAFNSKGGLGKLSEMLTVRTKKGPNPPALFSASSGETGKINLKWSIPKDRAIRGYLIKVSKSEKGTFKEIIRVDDPKTSSSTFGGESIEEGKDYYFQIHSIDKKGIEGNRSTVIAKGSSLPKPSPVTGLHILSAGIKSLLFQWDRHSDPDVKGYKLYMSDSRGGIKHIVGGVGSRRATDLTVNVGRDGGPEFGKLQFYSIVAVSTGGTESVHSNMIEASTMPLPSSPERLKAESGMVRQVKLTWEMSGRPKMISGYAIYRSNDGETFELLRRLRGWSKDEFTDSRYLEDNSSYFYKVVSYNVAGIESRSSGIVKAVTRNRPLRPEGLAGSSGGAGHAILTWTANSEKDIWKYKIWRSKNADIGFKLFGVSETVAYRDEPLEHGQKYYYRVSAINSGGLESELSETIFISTKLPPEPPIDIEATPTKTEINIKWTMSPSEGVTKYRVYEKSLFKSRVVATVKGTSYKVTGLKSGSFLSYYVTAINGSGLESGHSKAVNVKTLPD